MVNKYLHRSQRSDIYFDEISGVFFYQDFIELTDEGDVAMRHSTTFF